MLRASARREPRTSSSARARVSAVAVSLYVYTESLLVPIVLHIVLDALQGRYFVDFYQRRASAE